MSEKSEPVLPRKIIACVDGSDLSFRAVGYASQLAKVVGSKVVVLHVVLLPPYAATHTLEALRKDLSSKGQDILTKASQLVEANSVMAEERLVETNRSVVLAITEEAEKVQAELIVLGTRGTSGMPKLMLGSVAAGVVSSAHCPVLAVR